MLSREKKCYFISVYTLNREMLLRGIPKKTDGLITMPVLAQFGPGVETRLPTCSGQIFNMFSGPELLWDWPVSLVGCSIIGLEAMLL